MKHITFVILCTCLPFLLSAQSDKIQQLEKEILGTYGKSYIKKMLTLSELYLDEFMAKQAAEKAETAYKKARDFGDNILMAKALHQEGKALWMQKNLPKAVRRLSRSQKLLSDTKEHVLQLENAHTLLMVTIEKGKQSEIEAAENKLAILKEQIVLTAPEKSILRDKGLYPVLFPKEIALEQIAREAQSLSSTVATLEEDREELTEEREQLEVKKKRLESLVKRKQGEITKMSESQAKSELLLEKQKHLVDSLNYERLIDSFKLAFKENDLKQTEMALVEQEMKTELKSTQRNFFLSLAAIVLLVLGGLVLRFLGLRSQAAILEEKNKIIKEEKERSEDLLLNILPVAIANELKEKGEAKARRYENVTVLFADFQNFSRIAREMPAEHLIEELDFCFKAFDEIINKYQLEKIKTIGDAYMCAGGLPLPDNGHPTNVVKAALEMQRFLMDLKLKKVEKGEPFFEARIGIHSGPIIAGVVGLKKFAYDIWGDTVNVASRMESGGQPGKVNISGTTYDLVKHKFACKYRGKVPAKNMGEVDMYFVNSLN